MKPRILVALLGIALGLAGQAWAHPGHGVTEPSSLMHHTTEWIHSLPWWITLAAATASALGWSLRRRLA